MSEIYFVGKTRYEDLTETGSLLLFLNAPYSQDGVFENNTNFCKIWEKCFMYRLRTKFGVETECFVEDS